MTEVLDSGHVVTDEDVDTARLIMELDRTLGRPSDPLTRRVAATPDHQVHSLLGGRPPATPTPAQASGANGHAVPAEDELVATLTSEQNAADLAREVGEQLHLDPAEQARVIPAIQSVIRRRLSCPGSRWLMSSKIAVKSGMNGAPSPARPVASTTRRA